MLPSHVIRTVFAATLAVLLLCSPAAGAELDLSLELEGAGGYDSNRRQTPDEEGGAFFSLAPGLSLAWFASDDTEVNAGVSYARQEFLDGDLAFSETTLAHITVQRHWHRTDGILALGAGTYTDDVVPTDDQSWVSFAPGLRYTDAGAWQYSLHGLVRHGSYDSRATASGAEQDGTGWEVRPGILRPLSPRCSVWVEGYVEGYSSNEDSDEYSGLGMALGSTLFPSPRLLAQASATWGVRDYPNDYLDVVVDREDTPGRIEGHVAYRLFPWLEVFLSGRWSMLGSSEDSLDYEDWVVQCGTRLAQDVVLWEKRGAR